MGRAVVTARDLVEANAHDRRRLATALVAGAPGGREPELARPGGALAGGLVLAVLLTVGGSVAGHLGPGDRDAWDEPGLVVSERTGASYLVLDAGDHPTLRPVLNNTSARLAVEAGALHPRIVGQEVIDDQVLGEAVGIAGAPAALPSPSRLVQTGWTACAGEGSGLRVRVAASPAARPLAGSGLVVASRGVRYVVARAAADGGAAPTVRAYRLPGGPRGATGEQDALLEDLGLPIRAEATPVPHRWLALFPRGGDLGWASFGLSGLGRPAPAAGSLGVPVGARVGDVLATGEGSFLLTRRGPAELTAFALAVYRHAATPGGAAPRVIRVRDVPGAARAGRPYLAARWPASRLRPVRGRPCAQLATRDRAAPTVRLVSDPGGNDRVEAGVAPGRGAYVRVGGWGGRVRGSPYVVDAAGVASAVVGPDAVERLGYGDTAAPVVPVPWLGLFERGVPLSVDAALSGISSAGGS